MLDKRGQVFSALAQRGKLHREDNHAVVEIAPEAAGFNQLFKIAVRGRART
jgi:hypothetical protein